VSQEEVFEYCAKEVIHKSIEGYNGTIFAYGQTGSGKTFSMSGSPSNFNYRGIVPRAITSVFQLVGSKPEFEFVVKISYLEIYNEILLDLLSPIPTHEQKGEISLQEDNKGNLIIKGLSKHTVANEEEAFNLVFEGEANRTISAHELNKESTRSHCVFSVYLEMKSRIESSEKVITSKLNFVDLAGSERVKKTGSTGLTLKEANYINKSLTFLEQVVVSLTDKGKKTKKDHIPYRQSKLTHILKDSIGGNCRTVMIATIWPEEPYVFETLSTLNFAKRMMNVVNEATVNIQLDQNALLKKYQKEIKELKQELAMHNTLANRGRINYDPYTPEEQYQQQVAAKKFLTGETEELEFDSVRQAKELFYQCRHLFQKLWGNRDIFDSGVDKDKFSSNNLNPKMSKEKMNLGFEDGVGEVEVKPSFGIGKAPKDARPVNKCKNNIFKKT
jgi:kinesin family member 6/9